MQIPKNVQQELVILLQQGYSIDSVCKAMSKKYKGVELKKPDIIILAKRYNIKIGTKDLTKEKIDMNMAKNSTLLAFVLFFNNNNDYVVLGVVPGSEVNQIDPNPNGSYDIYFVR